MSTFFQFSDLLNKIYNGMEMVSASSCERHLSCSCDLLGFSSFNFVQSVFGVISMVDKSSSNGIVDAVGIFCRSSIVKTLVKKSFNVSALSFSRVALEPLVLFKVGIAYLVFNLDFAYFQNNFGLPFTIRARLRFKFLVRL